MIEKLVTLEVFTTVSHVLGHSIWLGLLAMVLYAFHFMRSPSHSAARRCYFGLLIIFCVPVASGILTWQPGLFSIPTHWSIVIPVWIANSLALIWVSGVTLFLWRLLCSLRQIAVLKKNTEEIETHQFDIPDQLAVRVSPSDQGPLLCGFWKPVIVLPKTLVNSAKAPCLRSIVAHEVAHFLRKDIPLNLLQSFIDMLLFFNPPVRWLSHQVRLEREKACDDDAVAALNGEKFVYASALLETESNLKCGKLMAAFGSDSTSDRATRIALGERNHQLPYSKSLAVICLLLVTGVSLCVVSVVEVASGTSVCGPQTIESPGIDFPTPLGIPVRILENEVLWKDKSLGNRTVPVLKSVTLIERDGIVYVPTEAEPQLFAEFPNAWVLENKLDLLKRNLPYTDPDGDLFTVAEEFAAKTDPMSESSHPPRALLLSFAARHFEMYRIKYAARTDESTVQLRRLVTKKHPRPNSFFMKVGNNSPDGKVQVTELRPSSILITQLETGEIREVQKSQSTDFKTYYAELSIRGGKNFFVKSGETFYLPNQEDTKWKLVSVSESDCIVAKVDNAKIEFTITTK